MMEEALALPPGESDDYQRAFAMYAVAAQTQHDPTPYLAQLEKCWVTKGSGIHSWTPCDAEEIRCRQTRRCPRLDLRLRMHVLNAAVIMLGREAPAQWRVEASRGLFVGERGYMQRL